VCLKKLIRTNLLRILISPEKRFGSQCSHPNFFFRKHISHLNYLMKWNINRSMNLKAGLMIIVSLLIEGWVALWVICFSVDACLFFIRIVGDYSPVWFNWIHFRWLRKSSNNIISIHLLNDKSWIESVTKIKFWIFHLHQVQKCYETYKTFILES